MPRRARVRSPRVVVSSVLRGRHGSSTRWELVLEGGGGRGGGERERGEGEGRGGGEIETAQNFTYFLPILVVTEQ